MVTCRRRRFLRASSVMTVVLAGCSSTGGGEADPADGTNTDGPTGETTDEGSDVTTEPTTTLTPTTTSTEPAPDPTQATRLAGTGDGFGWAVAVDGDTALVGANQAEEPNGSNAGTAYAFTRTDDDWQREARLVPDDGDQEDHFGESVAVAGDVAIVGAPDEEDPNGPRAGAAYAFTRTNGDWEQAAKLVPDDGATGDAFGRSVAVSDDTAVIGAPFHQEPGASYIGGAAYVFSPSGGSWQREAKLLADDADGGDAFGDAVAAVDGTAVVGAPGEEDPNGSGSGAAYVFSRGSNGWRQETKLAAADGDDDDEFGDAVAVADGVAVVGARRDEDPNGGDAGSAYAFIRADGAWNQAAKLVPDDGDEEDYFGRSVAADTGVALVGAHYDEDPNGAFGGSAYLFSREGDEWRQEAKLAAPDGGSNDEFGWSVTLDGSTAVIGAAGAGTAHVFSLE